MADTETELHPLLAALQPLADRIDAQLLRPDALEPDDVPLVWAGEVVGGVRLTPQERPSDLAHLLAQLAVELEGPLHTLDRAGRQRAVRLLDERGAFNYRKSVETVADVLGVTRFTIYNYLNRDRSD